MYILHLQHITVQMNRFSSAEHRCTVATALDSRNIGRVYHSRNFSWTVLLQESSEPGRAQFLCPGQAILYSYSSAPTLLLILTCPHSQPSREAGRNFPLIQKCGLCLFTWRSHSSQEQSRAVGQPVFTSLRPGPLSVYLLALVLLSPAWRHLLWPFWA